MMLCAIWYNLYKSKNVENTHRGVLLLVKNIIPPWLFFTLFFTFFNVSYIRNNHSRATKLWHTVNIL